MVWLILDILLVIFIVSSVFAGYRQGLLGSVLRLAGFFVAIAAAAVLSDKISPYVFNSFVYEKLIAIVSEQIATNPTASDILNAINSGVVGILIGIGVVSADSFASKLAALQGSDSAAIAKELVEGVLAEPVTAIIKTILFVVSFVVAFFIVKMLLRALMGVNKVPLLGPVNKLLGSVFGLAQGLLIDLLAVKLISAVMSATMEGSAALQNVAVPKTIVFAFLYNFQLF